jgi:hypothetical protein
MKNLMLLGLLSLFMTGCTLSFQNISTHGTASDVVDQNQDANADAQLDIPASVL